MQLRIAPDPTLLATPGDFGACLDENAGELRVPVAVASSLRELGLTTPRDWLSSLRAFPESYALLLGWPLADVLAAAERVTDALQGVVDLPPHRDGPRRRYGARAPQGSRRRDG